MDLFEKWAKASWLWRYELLVQVHAIPGGYELDTPPPLGATLLGAMRELVEDHWQPDYAQALARLEADDTMAEHGVLLRQAQRACAIEPQGDSFWAWLCLVEDEVCDRLAVRHPVARDLIWVFDGKDKRKLFKNSGGLFDKGLSAKEAADRVLEANEVAAVGAQHARAS
jgi:hypothetical protein